MTDGPPEPVNESFQSVHRPGWAVFLSFSTYNADAGPKDGTVYATSGATAVKAFIREDAFSREAACYQRLRERNVEEILGFSVPWLINADTSRWILEMTIVDRPFLLDFASAHLDYPPDFPAEVIDQWEHEKHDLFGANWSRVQILLQILQDKYDIYLLDVHPANIAFAEPDIAR
jgi:hypothetical protein